MDNNLSDKLKKRMKTNKIGVFVSFILIAVIILLFYIPSVLPNYIPKESKSMLDLVEDGLYDEIVYSNEFANLDITYLSGSVASYGEENSSIRDHYYLAWDSNNYMYIVQVDDADLFGKLYGIYYETYDENSELVKTANLEGMTKKIPEELKKIVLDVMTEYYPDMGLTDDNFENMFGSIYLDATSGPYDTYNAICWGSAGVLIIASITIFAINISKISISKKTIKRLKKNNEYEEVFEQLDSTDLISFEIIDIYLTRDYIIDFTEGFKVFKYDEAKWIYKFVQRVNFAETNAAIVICTNKGKQYYVSKMTSGHINHQLLDKIIDNLKIKCPNAMLGFTDENKKAYKEFKKEIKKQ